MNVYIDFFGKKIIFCGGGRGQFFLLNDVNYDLINLLHIYGPYKENIQLLEDKDIVIQVRLRTQDIISNSKKK